MSFALKAISLTLENNILPRIKHALAFARQMISSFIRPGNFSDDIISLTTFFAYKLIGPSVQTWYNSIHCLDCL